MKNKQSQNHSLFHVSRMVLCGLLVVSVLLARSDTAAFKLISLTSETSTENVLAYATNMTIGDLLSAANDSRTANGLSKLQLNSQLNSSAQAKAQHMITNDYWAHVAPDGTQPWYFIDQSGYNYERAGENLARGFDTGYEANTGWMNSPTHRDNILGDYAEVGFGIASGPTYQGGENTVVVAHYGKPVGWSPAPVPTQNPTPTPAPPAPAPAPTSNPVANNSSPSTATNTQPVSNSSPSETASPTNNNGDNPKLPSDVIVKPKTNTSNNNRSISASSEKQNDSKKVSVLEQLTSGEASSAVYASLSIVTISTAGYAMAHKARIKYLLAKGKKIALHHPMFDIMIIGTALIFILSATTGYLL